MSAENYIGEELDLFAHATTWKEYWASHVLPWLGDDVLEVGAGIGGTTRAICRRKHRRWVCLEPDAKLAAKLELARDAEAFPTRCEVKVGTMASLPETEQFDSILYIDVLEHIEDDLGEMRLAAKHLRPGGTLIVLSPAHPWLYSEFDKAIGHYRRYTREMLAAAAPPHPEGDAKAEGGAGLRIEKLTYLDAVGAIASAANRLMLRAPQPHLKQILLWDRRMVPVSKIVDPLLAGVCGRSVLGVWRKDDASRRDAGSHAITRCCDAKPVVKPACILEAIVAGIALAMMMGLTIALSGARYIFGRDFWLDEIFAVLIASDKDPRHALDALTHGVDTNPPTLHILLRLWGSVAGFGEKPVRLFAFGMVWLALVGVYLLLRRSLPRLPAAVGAMAVWACPLVLEHSVEARFYAPWLAFAAWFALALSLTRDSRRPWLAQPLLLVTSILLCTIHYFGVFTFGLILAADLLLDSRPIVKRIVTRLPTLAGIAALVLCVPIFKGQRASISVPTWDNEPATIQRILTFWLALVPVWSIVIVLAMHVLTRGARRDVEGRHSTIAQVPASPRIADLGSLFAVVLLPVVIAAFTFVVQPALAERYGTVASLAIAPVAALLASTALRSHARFAIVALFVAACFSMATINRGKMRVDDGFKRDRNLVLEQTADRPVVFGYWHDLAPILRKKPELASRCFNLDFDDAAGSNAPIKPNHFMTVTRDLGRVLEEFYGKPRLIRREKLAEQFPFFIIGSLDDAKWITAGMEGVRIERVDDRLFKVTHESR